MGDAENVFKIVLGTENALRELRNVPTDITLSLVQGVVARKDKFQAEVQLKDIMTLDNIEKVSCECAYVSPVTVLNAYNKPLQVEISTLAQHTNYDTRYRTAPRVVAVLEPGNTDSKNTVQPNVSNAQDNNLFYISSDFYGAPDRRIQLRLDDGYYDGAELLDEINRLIRYNPALSVLRSSGVAPYLNADYALGRLRITNLDNADTTKYYLYFGSNSASAEFGFERFTNYGPSDWRNPALGTPLVAPSPIALLVAQTDFVFKTNLGKFNLTKEHLNSHIWEVKVSYIDQFTRSFDDPFVTDDWLIVMNFAY